MKRTLQNSLVITNRADSIACREKTRSSRVTIVTGIICGKVIVLASDSQTTYSPLMGASQRLDTPKISTLEFFDDAVGLVAQAGNATLSGRAVEILTDMVRGKKIDDYRTIADLAQSAVRQVKQELREQNLNCSMEELHDYIQKNELNFELMIGYHHEEKPYIYTINLSVGIAAKCPHKFIAIGCGSAVATYILDWFKIDKNFQFKHGVLAAIYAIEEVKKVDPFCGGKTRVGVISPNPISPKGMSALQAANLFLNADYSKYAEALEEIDKAAKSEWASRMNTVLFETSSKVGKAGTAIVLKANQ